MHRKLMQFTVAGLAIAFSAAAIHAAAPERVVLDWHGCDPDIGLPNAPFDVANAAALSNISVDDLDKIAYKRGLKDEAGIKRFPENSPNVNLTARTDACVLAQSADFGGVKGFMIAKVWLSTTNFRYYFVFGANDAVSQAYAVDVVDGMVTRTSRTVTSGATWPTAVGTCIFSDDVDQGPVCYSGDNIYAATPTVASVISFPF